MKKATFWNIMWGLLFIAAAGLIILRLFGLLSDITPWSIILSVPIAVGVIACAVKFAWFGMFILLGVLAWLHRIPIQEMLGIEYGMPTLIAIVVLLSIGFHILFKQKKLWKSKPRVEWSYTPEIESASGEKVFFEEKFTGASKYITSENLSYVRIQNSFGGMEVYFTNATPAEGGTIVDIDNRFGGVELFIPQSWNIINQISDFAGQTDMHNASFEAEGVPTITLRGSNQFGGIDVKRI